MAASVNPGQPPEAEGPAADQPAGEAAGGKAVATPASNFGPAPAAPPAPNSSRGGGGRRGRGGRGVVVLEDLKKEHLQVRSVEEHQ